MKYHSANTEKQALFFKRVLKINPTHWPTTLFTRLPDDNNPHLIFAQLPGGDQHHSSALPGKAIVKAIPFVKALFNKKESIAGLARSIVFVNWKNLA